ncbi:hypothetical protein GQ600_1237 [Phytophthora cactorum]|nr:hypothetical protein GQ600_1237 [Phytophthora cactorum]
METPITGQCDSVEQGANGLSKAEDGANKPPYSPTSTGLEGTSNATNAEYSDISPDSMMKSESREARDRISQEQIIVVGPQQQARSQRTQISTALQLNYY